MSSDMVVNNDFATMVLFVFGGVSQGYTSSESICILMHLKIEMWADFASAQAAEEDEQGWQFGTPSADCDDPQHLLDPPSMSVVSVIVNYTPM